MMAAIDGCDGDAGSDGSHIRLLTGTARGREGRQRKGTRGDQGRLLTGTRGDQGRLLTGTRGGQRRPRRGRRRPDETGSGGGGHLGTLADNECDGDHEDDGEEEVVGEGGHSRLDRCENGGLLQSLDSLLESGHVSLETA